MKALAMKWRPSNEYLSIVLIALAICAFGFYSSLLEAEG